MDGMPTSGELKPLLEALRSLQRMSLHETVLLLAAEAHPSTETLAALRIAHMDEVNIIQALIARADLLERRYPAIRDPVIR